jgi:hypothetical protein
MQNDPVPPPRTSSPQDLTRVNSSSGSRSRKSSDRQSATPSTNAASGSGSASFDKSRAIRMFVNSNNKVPSERDGDSQLSHRKSESWRSEQLFADDEIAEASNIVTVKFLHALYNFF